MSRPKYPLQLMLIYVLVLVFFVGASASAASPLRFSGYELTNFGAVAPDGMTAGDFDGDGVDDIAVASSSQMAVIAVLGGTNGNWRTRQVFAPASLLQAVPQLLTWKRQQGDALVVVVRNEWWYNTAAMVIVFDGVPLRESHRFPLQASVHAAWIGDVDADGEDELLSSSPDETRYYDLATGMPGQTVPFGGEDVLATQLDADPALEVVLASTPGRVFDGATQAIEWTYSDGFGSYLAAGRFSGNGAMQFVGARNWSIMTVFQALPWSPIWDLERFDIDAVAVADFDGDGRDEIIQGDGQWGSVNIIDTETRQIGLTIPHNNHGVAALVAADFTGDGMLEIAFASRSPYDGAAINVVEPPSTEVRSELLKTAGPIGAMALADVDADGQLEVVAASSESPSRVLVVNHATGGIENNFGGSSWNANDPFYLANHFVLTAQLDADPALELVLVGNAFDGQISVVDAVSGLVQLQIGSYSSGGPFGSRHITGAELIDFDRDGTPDIVVSTQAASSGTSGVRLHVFSLTSGQLLWESVAMGTGFAPSHGVAVIPGAGGGADTLVAALDGGLRAYDSVTRLLSWQLETPVDTLAYVPDAEGGPQLVVASATGQVQHLDASTRAPVHSYALPAPITAIKPLPGEGRVLIIANGIVTLVDPVLAQVTSLDEYAVGSFPEHGSVAAFAEGNDFKVVAGTPFGWARMSVTPESVLFRDGFER